MGKTVPGRSGKNMPPQLLAYLFRNRGSVVTRDMLLEHVWNQEADPSSNTVNTHVRSLRRKLGIGAKPLIRTIAGTGYQIDLNERPPVTP